MCFGTAPSLPERAFPPQPFVAPRLSFTNKTPAAPPLALALTPAPTAPIPTPTGGVIGDWDDDKIHQLAHHKLVRNKGMDRALDLFPGQTEASLIVAWAVHKQQGKELLESRKGGEGGNLKE
ncbi:hypothetical protein ACN47E_001700 [Coniothyrium glycines]